ncbi:GGDEF domain-containing protein [Billgrantia pellis]|uniref:diguanylate cyclase n=2 Tax=Billgrantia pellis TaxID=2606936 RepID=A0A7V7KFY2_9GAMM|nr:GGDEF domain-containing protein [Halomonas pellis]
MLIHTSWRLSLPQSSHNQKHLIVTTGKTSFWHPYRLENGSSEVRHSPSRPGRSVDLRAICSKILLVPCVLRPLCGLFFWLARSWNRSAAIHQPDEERIQQRGNDMRMKSKSMRYTNPGLAGLALAVALALDAALSLGGMVPAKAALFPTASALFSSFLPKLLHTGAIVAFISGIILAVVLILLPMRQAYRAREARLLRERKRLEERSKALQQQAASDGLLGIANRREFERVLDLEWRRAARERQPLSLVLIDIDCFKVFNDTYGHLEGDTCLCQVANVLREAAARPGDLVARYGGEEMVILMPRTDLDGATRMAQRVHEMLAERALPFTASPITERVTVSIGVSSLLPKRHIDAHTLVHQADEGLYAAKENGRNQTVAVPRLRLIASGPASSLPQQASGA